MNAATRRKAKSPQLGDYPFNWQRLEDFRYPKDESGLPMVDMGKQLGLKYSPVTIAQYGLFNLQQFAATEVGAAFDLAELCGRWLIENFKDWRAGIGAWVYNYDLSFYGPQAPWISGMAQAQGISLLLRIHQLTADAQIPEITRRAFRAFLQPTAEGGVVSHFPDGSLIFEEYPTEPPSHVLNGHIFALLGIHDYAVYWQDKAARELFDVAAEGLKRNLERYDTGYWNLYDLHPTRRLASAMYVEVHVQLMRILAQLTSEPLFLAVSENWAEYLRRPLCRVRWFVGKVVEKVRLRF